MAIGIGTYISVYLGSTIKILIAVGGASTVGLVGWRLSLTVFAGGMTGVAFFALAGTSIRKWLSERRRKRGVRPDLGKARRMLRLWRKFGLPGVALLTPPLLSPPIGPTLASAFGERFGRIMLYMGVSMAGWSILFGLFAEQIHNLLTRLFGS